MTPYFSIVLPTKNRSAIVPTAIQSVLNQRFSDFELCVVDNDDTDDTKKAIVRFDDSRIRYIRTGNLSMADNWNRGFVESHGEYTLVIGDKHVLTKDALASIYQLVETQYHPVVLWAMGDYRIYNERGYLRLPPEVGAVTRIETVTMLSKFTKNANSSPLSRHRAYNSATHRSVLDKMLNSGAQRACIPVAPDYSLIYQHLAYVDTLVCIPSVLSLGTLPFIGTGATFAAETNPAIVTSFIQSSGGPSVFYSHVPIKSATLEYSFLYNDYLRVRELVGGKLQDYDLDMVNYFRACYLELVKRKRFFNADVSSEHDAWKTALRMQPTEVQAGLSNLTWLGLQAAIRWTSFKLLRQQLLPLRYAWKRRHQQSFSDIFEALDWLDTQRHPIYG